MTSSITKEDHQKDPAYAVKAEFYNVYFDAIMKLTFPTNLDHYNSFYWGMKNFPLFHCAQAKLYHSADDGYSHLCVIVPLWNT